MFNDFFLFFQRLKAMFSFVFLIGVCVTINCELSGGGSATTMGLPYLVFILDESVLAFLIVGWIYITMEL